MMNSKQIESPQLVYINNNDVSNNFIQESDTPSTYGLVGLINIENTCYMNSAIQAFSHNYLLTNYFFNHEEEIKTILLRNAGRILKDNDAFQTTSLAKKAHLDIVPESLKIKICDLEYHPNTLTETDMTIVLNHTITFQLIKLLKIMWSIVSNHNIIPTSFYTLFSEARDKFFYGHEQHDAEEAYSCILQKVQEELAEEKKINFVPHKQSICDFLSYKNKIAELLKNANLEDKRLLLDAYYNKKKEMPVESLTIEAYREMKNYYSTNYSRITEIFSGFLHSSTNCPDPNCNYSSNKFDPYLHLFLSIPATRRDGTYANSPVGGFGPNTTRPSTFWDRYSNELTIEDCLAEYCKTEILDDQNLWKCGGCNTLVRAVKKLEIWRAPPVLVIGFKRFGEDRARKDIRMIRYPIKNFDIGPYMSKPQQRPEKCTTYRLQCVINHIGSASGGHYFSYCIDEDTNKWHEFNDQNVNEIDANCIINRNAYLLFYVREDFINS